jgi:hypothetical protein
MERMRITSSGNVGIGTTSPGKTLHIAANGHHIALEDTNGTVGSKMVGIFNNNQQLHLGRYSDDNFNDFTTDLFIKSTGNVGIGTTNPSAELHVNNSSTSSTIRLTSVASITSTDGAFLRLDNSGNFILNNKDTGETIFQEQGNEVMRITSAGNVGIGTTNPTQKLDINGVTTFGGGNGFIRHDSPGWLALQAGTSGVTISNNVNNQELVAVLDNGKVGIGTTDPIAELDVYGFGKLIGITSTHSDTTRITHASLQADANGYGSIHAYNNVGNPMVRLKSNGDSYLIGGNVGIGTTNPTGKLEISGTITINPPVADSGLWFGTNNVVRGYIGGGDFAVNGLGASEFGKLGVELPVNIDLTTGLFVRNNSSHSGSGGSNIASFHGPDDYAMQIKCDGRVGIGTTNPSRKLHVNGIIYGTTTAIFGNLSTSSDVQTNANKELISTSDKRLKNDLGDCEYGLNEVLQVQPKKYTWKEGPEDQKPTVGVFAQDVHAIMPEAAPREAIQNENGEDDYRWGFHSQTIIESKILKLKTPHLNRAF